MGQAAVDLSDTAPASAAPTNSADDMLAQLAGDEIDRLLAEGEAAQAADPVPSSTDGAAAPSEITTVDDPALAAQLDELLRDSEEEKSAEPASPPQAVAAAAPVVASVAEMPAAAHIDTPVPTVPTEPAKAEDTGTDQAERAALNEAVDQIHPPTPAELAETVAEDDSVPLILKPLVWLNAPMSILPDAIRDALGKVAVLTLFNALAVFAYVLLFRKHHH